MPIRLLIAEDQTVVLEDLTRALERVGYQIDGKAGSPGQLIELTEKLLPDLIVIDANLCGDMNGLHAAIQLQQAENVPVVFLAAYAKDVVDQGCEVQLPYRILAKPFSVPELRAAVEALLPDRPTSLNDGA